MPRLTIDEDGHEVTGGQGQGGGQDQHPELAAGGESFPWGHQLGEGTHRDWGGGGEHSYLHQQEEGQGAEDGGGGVVPLLPEPLRVHAGGVGH